MTALSALEASLDDGDARAQAEPDTRRIDVLGPQGETIRTLDLAHGGLTVGQAAGNQLVLAGEGVGRYHLRITSDGARVAVTDLGSRSGTLLDERRLPAQVEQDWLSGEVLRLGTFRLRLEQAGGRQDGPHARQTIAATPSASRIGVGFDAGRETLELTPGQTALVMLVLTNHSGELETALLSVEGLPTAWVKLPEQDLHIPAHGSLNVPLHTFVPRAAECRAGEYSVTIRARAQSDLAKSSVAAARWTVLPFFGSSLELKPRKRAVRGRRPTFYTVSLRNTGNLPASYSLRAGDDEPALDYQFDQNRLNLEPGGTASLRLAVQARENPAGRTQNYTFGVHVLPSNSPPVAETGQLNQTVPFPAWLLPVLLLALLVPLLAATWWFLRSDQAAAASAGIAISASPVASATFEPTPTLDIAAAVVAPTPMPDLNALIQGTQSAIAAATQAADEQAAQDASNPKLQAIEQSYQLVQTQLAQVVQAGGSADATGAGGSTSGGASGGGSASDTGGSGASSGGSSGGVSGGSAGAESPASETPASTPTGTSTSTPTETPTGTLITTSTPTTIPANTATNTSTATPTITPTPTRTPTSTPLPAARVTFFRQPGSSTGGTLLSQQPIMQIEDSAGVVVASFSGQVTIVIQNDACQPAPRTPILGGVATVSISNGIGTFTDLAIDCAGNGYTFQATVSGLPSVVSQPFNVNIGPAHHLLFLAAPNNTPAGSTLAPNTLVRAVDLGNNRVATYTNSIRVAITSATGTSGANLSGTTRLNASGGEATYTNLSINRVGVDYTLTATSSGLNGVSSPFDITADRLTFASAPGNTRANDNLGAIVVQATDSAGTIDTTFTGQVVLALLAGNPSGALANGPTSAAASGGVATFSSALRIGQIGLQYQLQASSGTLSGLSNTFNITADRLVFLNAPSDTRVNSDLGALRVQATDGFGNLDTSFNGSIALTLIGGTSGARLRNGATAVNAAGGIADFGSALRIDRVGMSYQIRASGGGADVDSATFNITADRLSFFSAPGDTRANANLGAIEVRATDSLGNIDQSFTASIALSLNGGHALGQLYNNVISVAAASGVATFGANLRIDHLGQNYRLRATGGGLASNSGTFDVTADRLIFVNSPSDTRVNRAFAVQPDVVAADGFGDIDTFTAYTITLELAGGTAGSQLTPVANTTVAMSSGVANYTKLEVDTIGTSYRLRATNGLLTSDSNPPPTFDITP
jgi:pSer/pThr/pTyr-binding forkhead associated (FHA) protein